MLLDIRDKLALFENFFSPFSRGGALLLADRQPRIYRALVVALAAAGYLSLFLFPVLMVSMPVILFSSVQSEMTALGWFFVTVEALVFLISAIISYAIFSLRFSEPSGLELTEEGFPRLFELLEELAGIYGEPRIDRVILRDRYDVRIVKTPRNGFPLSATRTLIIGLPVLLTMSPMDVHVLLARRIGQLAGRHSRVNSWLYSLRELWSQYLNSCARYEPPLARPVCAFFRWYAPLYRAFSVGLARRSELEADAYALQAINDNDSARAITCQVVTEAYLSRSYWPGILQNAKQSVKQEVLPHADMEKLFKSGLPDKELQATLKQVEKTKRKPSSAMPDLSERLDQIGHIKPMLPKPMSVTAARFYLGGACEACIETMDKRSLKKIRSKVIKQMSRKS